MGRIAPARRVGRVLRPGAADLPHVRALSRAARRGPRPRRRRPSGGRPRRSPAPRRHGSPLGRCSRRCGRAGSPALLAHEPARAAESLRARLGAHAARGGRRARRRSRSRPSSSRRSPELGELDEALGGDRSPARAGRAAGASVGARDREAVRRARAARLRTLRRARGRDARGGGGRLRASSACASTGALAAEPRPGAAAAQEVGRRARRARNAPWPRSTSWARRGWAEEARSELARVGARRPAPSGELTPAERRVVELAAEGRANKEIAPRAARHRAHGRGAPLARLREARRALARAARAAAFPAGRSAVKD